MTWPTDDLETTHFDSGGGQPVPRATDAAPGAR